MSDQGKLPPIVISQAEREFIDRWAEWAMRTCRLFGVSWGTAGKVTEAFASGLERDAMKKASCDA